MKTLKALLLAALVGVLVAVVKGNEGGARAAIGNLVAPWLLPGVYVVYQANTIFAAFFVTWVATAFALGTFYAVQGMIWSMVNGHTILYDASWLVGGATVCGLLATIAFAALRRDLITLLLTWLGASIVTTALYGAYLVSLGIVVGDVILRTVLIADAAFCAAVLAVLATLWCRRSRGVAP